MELDVRNHALAVARDEHGAGSGADAEVGLAHLAGFVVLVPLRRDRELVELQGPTTDRARVPGAAAERPQCVPDEVGAEAGLERVDARAGLGFERGAGVLAALGSVGRGPLGGATHRGNEHR